MTTTDGARASVIEDHSARSYGWTFWVGLLIGWSLIAYAVWGMWSQQADANPPGLLKWVLGLALLHDAVVAPVVTVAGLLLAAVLPERVRGPVIAALGASVLVVVFAIPLVRTFGKRELNSSTLPLDYSRNLVIVLVVIWAVALAVVAVRARRSER
jgi:hypothetical protein